MSNLFSGIEHIGIKAINMEKSIQFYVEVLGFQLLKRTKPGEIELAFLHLGGTVVELVEMREPVRERDGLVNHLALSVPDIFAATRWLEDHGIELRTPEPVCIGEGCYNLFFRGPSGEKLELLQGTL